MGAKAFALMLARARTAHAQWPRARAQKMHWTASCELRTASCGLRTANCERTQRASEPSEPKTARRANCLQLFATVRLASAVCGRHTKRLAIKVPVCALARACVCASVQLAELGCGCVRVRVCPSCLVCVQWNASKKKKKSESESSKSCRAKARRGRRKPKKRRLQLAASLCHSVHCAQCTGCTAEPNAQRSTLNAQRSMLNAQLNSTQCRANRVRVASRETLARPQ